MSPQLDRHPLYFGFLYHLVHEQGFTAEQLLGVIEKPWNWGAEFRLWLDSEGER